MHRYKNLSGAAKKSFARTILFDSVYFSIMMYQTVAMCKAGKRKKKNVATLDELKMYFVVIAKLTLTFPMEKIQKR